MMKRVFSALVLTLSTAAAAQAGMSVQLLSPWDGKKIPAGQQCSVQGGKAATPPMQVSGLPAGTSMVVAEFNDRSYQPLSRNGGHGVIGWPVKGSDAKLAPIPEGAAKGPGGAMVVKDTRGTLGSGKGYLPPCSGGRGNSYEAVIKAVGADGKVLEKLRVKLGRY